MADGHLIGVAGGVMLLAAVSFLCSAAQTALFRLESMSLDRLRKDTPAQFASLGWLLERPAQGMGLLLLVDVLATVPLVLLALYLCRSTPWVVGLGLPMWGVAGVVIGFVGVFCELIPKLVGYARPEAALRAVKPLLAVASPFLLLPSRGFSKLSDVVVGWLTPQGLQPHQSLNEDELDTLVRVGEEEGALLLAESEIIQEIIKLEDKTAKDCMTPRVDMQAVPDDLSAAALLEEIRNCRHPFLPVYHDTPDSIVGMLDVIAFLDGTDRDYVSEMGEPWYVAETMGATPLLQEFLKTERGLAVIVDEYGGTEGVVTLSDIVDDIINDAVPEGDHSLYIEIMGDGSLLVDGRARLDDISDELGLEIEAAGGIDTIGGLVFNHLGYLPKAVFAVDIAPLSIIVRRVKKKRITELLVRLQSNGEAGSESDLPSSSGGEHIL